jgi:hypothetical protein
VPHRPAEAPVFGAFAPLPCHLPRGLGLWRAIRAPTIQPRQQILAPPAKAPLLKQKGQHRRRFPAPRRGIEQHMRLFRPHRQTGHRAAMIGDAIALQRAKAGKFRPRRRHGRRRRRINPRHRPDQAPHCASDRVKAPDRWSAFRADQRRGDRHGRPLPISDRQRPAPDARRGPPAGRRRPETSAW